TQRIYDTFGIGDRFGFYIDGGHQHCATLPAEAPAITAFVDKFMLGQSDANTDVEVNPYPNLDYARWTSWWGRDPNHDPQFPDNWNTGGTVVLSLERTLGGLSGLSGLSGFNLPGAIPINTGDTIQADYQLLIPNRNNPDATASLVNGNIQADIRCFDGSSYTLTIPLPANQSYA